MFVDLSCSPVSRKEMQFVHFGLFDVCIKKIFSTLTWELEKT